MPYETFWHLNPKKLEPFQVAYKKRLEQEDYFAWLNGKYIQAAIGSCLDSKHCKYPSRPMTTEAQETETLSGEEQFILWIDAYNRSYDGNNA